MYYINSLEEVPNLEFMFGFIKECMESGIKIRDLTGIKSKYQIKVDNSKTILYNRYGLQNPNSPTQVLAMIDRNMDDIVKSYCYDEEKNKWTTDGNAMEGLAGLGYEFAELLLEYRRSSKRVSTLNQLEEYRDSRGFVHPVVSKCVTNRISMSEPAIMNIHKDMLYDVIEARGKGNYIISVDIKNQEPWIIINMLKIRSLKHLMASLVNGESLYREMFKVIFGREVENDAEYEEMKTAWNALSYGCSKKRTIATCKCVDGNIIYKAFMSVKELAQFSRTCSNMKYGRNKTVRTYFGTKIDGSNPSNSIQGTGADILALLISHFVEEVELRGLESDMWVYFTRHDELLIEVRGSYFESVGEQQVIAELREIFEHKIDDWEPFRVDVDVVCRPDGERKVA